MADLTNLPRDLTPSQFFLDILPEVLSEVELPSGLGTERLQLHIRGEDGLAVNIGVDEEGDLTIDPDTADHPPLAITMTEQDFRAVLSGDLRDKVRAATGHVAIEPRQLRKAFLPDAKVQRIKAFKGDIQIRVVDKEDAATYVATLTLGGATPNVDKPTCTVTIEVPTLLELLTGKQQAQQLFFAGKLRIDGDMSIVLGLMSALSAP